MKLFNTIHIFGTTEVQIIGKENKGKVASSTLTKLESFIDHIKSFKPTEVVLTDHHVIHIFSDSSVRYLGKRSENRADKTSFSVKFSDVNQTILSDLVDEIVANLPTKE